MPIKQTLKHVPFWYCLLSHIILEAISTHMKLKTPLYRAFYFICNGVKMLELHTLLALREENNDYDMSIESHIYSILLIC